MIQVGASFSTGRVAYKHDTRETISPNVTKDLIGDDIVLEDNLMGESIEDYTNKVMQPYIDEYNNKQKRKDRRIKGTYTEYFYKLKDHGKLSYEAVCQFGEAETIGQAYYKAENPEEKAELKNQFVDVYTCFFQELKKKYPHISILYATIHFDEENGTPHMHIGYQPIGEGYKQGLSHQVSLSKALSLDGIERVTKRADIDKYGGYQVARWYYEVRHGLLEPLVKEKGYSLKPEVKGRRHYTPSVFVEEKKAISQEKLAALEASVGLEEERQEVQQLAVALEERENKVEATEKRLEAKEQALLERESKVEVAESAILSVQKEVKEAVEVLEKVSKSTDPFIRFRSYIQGLPVPEAVKNLIIQSTKSFAEWEKNALEKLKKLDGIAKWNPSQKRGKNTIIKQKELESLER